LYTNIDLDLAEVHREAVSVIRCRARFVALEPKSGEVLAFAQRTVVRPQPGFVGRVPAKYYDSLMTETKRHPMYNKGDSGERIRPRFPRGKLARRDHGASGQAW